MLKLYPIISVTLNNNIAEQEIPKLWQETQCPSGQTIYGLYSNYESDSNGNYLFSIATETPNGNEAIVIEDLTWYEKFSTKREQILATWQSIWRKEKQGMLPRSYLVDFERYTETETEIFIGVRPHC